MSDLYSDYDFTKIPFEKVEYVGQRSMIHRDLFTVSWILGRFCNYSCSYCWPYASTKVKDHRPTDVVIKNIESIKSQARARGFNSFHFSFSGGEPSLHPGYLDILSHYSNDTENCNYQSVHMTSNLSLNMQWYEKYVEATRKLNRASITASFHAEFAKPEQFKEKIIFLQSNEVHVTINMVMVPERFDLLWQRALEFHDAGINVTLKPQSNTNATQIVDGYTDQQLELLQNGLPQLDYTKRRLDIIGKNPFRKLPKFPKAYELDEKFKSMQVELRDNTGQPWYVDQAERLNSFSFNKFPGWECSAGYRSIIIREPGGIIKRSYSCSDQPLGSLDDGFQLFVKDVSFIKGDLTQLQEIDSLFSKFNIQTVIHLASSAYVGESVENPLKYYQNNIVSSINLFSCMLKYNVKKIIFSSSCAIYGNAEELPITENHVLNPINPYGQTKKMIEQMLLDLSLSDGFRHICLRFFNVAGADQQNDIGEWHNPEPHLIPTIFNVMENSSLEFKIMGTDYPTHDGTCIRDFIHVEDIVEAHLLSLNYLENHGASQVLNLGTGKPHSILEIISTIKKITQKNFLIKNEARRNGDPAILFCSSDKAKKILNWESQYSDLNNIIETAWNWHKKIIK